MESESENSISVVDGNIPVKEIDKDIFAKLKFL